MSKANFQTVDQRVWLDIQFNANIVNKWAVNQSQKLYLLLNLDSKIQRLSSSKENQRI